MKAANLNENQQSISFSSLAIISRLGRGSTSHVFKTQSIRTKQMYAMKVIDKADPDYSKQILDREIAIHSKLNYEHIVKLVEHFEDSENHYLLTEYCPDGEATKFLLQTSINEDTISTIAYQVALALDYLHNVVKIAHGDIKLSNILLFGSKIKLCDFGFSISFQNQESRNPFGNSAFGTLLYAAPETLSNNPNCFYKESDIWSLGICLLTLMLKGKPYRATTDKQLQELVKKGDYINPIDDCSQFFSAELIDIVVKMLEKDPKKRPTASEILDCPFFSKLKHVNISGAKDQNYCKGQKKDKKKISKSKKILSPTHKTPLKSQKKPRIGKSCDQSPKQIIKKAQPGLHCESKKQKERKQSYQLKEENSFNKTADTSFMTDESPLEDHSIEKKNCQFEPFYCWCLKPQIQKTKQNGYIQIKKDHSIRIKIKTMVFTINSSCSQLTLEKKSGTTKKYNLSSLSDDAEPKEVQKITCLVDYAREVITLMKKKQCQFELIEKNRYYWIQRLTSKQTFEGSEQLSNQKILYVKEISEKVNEENLLVFEMREGMSLPRQFPKCLRTQFH